MAVERLFKPGFVYPSDRHGGRYVEVTGRVVEVTASGRVTVESDRYGTQRGYVDEFLVERGHLPTVGHSATIRCYDSGGGWYPDDRVVSWEVV